MTPFQMLQSAVVSAPSNAEAWSQLGGAYLDREEPEPAIAHLRRAVELAPLCSSYSRTLAHAYREAGRLDEAEAELRRTLARSPDEEDVRRQLGELLLLVAERAEDALHVLEEALRPGGPPVGEWYAMLYLTAAASCDAEAGGEGTRRLDAAKAIVTARFGTTIAETSCAIAVARHGRYEEARRSCEEILRSDPDCVLALSALGHVEGALGTPARGLDHLHAAMRIALDDAIIQGLYLRQLLWCGDYAGAAATLPRCEAFLQLRAPAVPPPRWTGEDLRGRTLLVRARSGLGDTFNFIRAARWWRDRGATVIVETRPKLVELVRQADGVSEACAPFDEHPPGDYYVDLMWSWLQLAPPLDRLGADMPCVRVPAPRLEYWRRRLSGARGLRGGLAWGGEPVQLSPFHTRQYRRNAAAFRSAPLERLAPLAAVPGVQFFSLQVGNSPYPDISRAFGGPIVDLAPEIRPLTEMAAAIAALDLVVSIDTSVAHLAGAIGTPLYVMLPFVACWRWLTGRADSPWYPRARLFRQAAPGDWDSVASAVAHALGRWTSARTPTAEDALGVPRVLADARQ